MMLDVVVGWLAAVALLLLMVLTVVVGGCVCVFDDQW